MEINLRKARKLEGKIPAAIVKESGTELLEVLASTPPEMALSDLAQARLRLQEQLSNNIQLVEARFSIRRKIEQTNESVGINNLVNAREVLNTKIAYLNLLQGLQVCSDRELLDKLEHKRKVLDKGESSYHSDGVTITSGIISKTEKEALLSQIDVLKKQLEDIEEELVQKNVGVKITLSANEVTLLQSNGLL
jgi:hypothetical protein